MFTNEICFKQNITNVVKNALSIGRVTPASCGYHVCLFLLQFAVTFVKMAGNVPPKPEAFSRGSFVQYTREHLVASRSMELNEWMNATVNEWIVRTSTPNMNDVLMSKISHWNDFTRRRSVRRMSTSSKCTIQVSYYITSGKSQWHHQVTFLPVLISASHSNETYYSLWTNVENVP